MPPLGLFGKRCRIKHVSNMKEGFVYRIVSDGIRSNCWTDLPLGHFKSKPKTHNTIEDIVIVVCDTLIDDHSKFERVRLKDIENYARARTWRQQKIGEWINDGFYAERYNEHAYRCSECDKQYIGYVGEFKYCSNCGVKMEVEEW